VFYDSKGLEVEDASKTYLLLMSDLLNLRFGPVARNHIDIVLMCIQEPQGRIDDAHLEIAGLCEDLQIPFGILITKTEGNPALEVVVRQTFARAAFVRRVRSIELKLGDIVIPAEGLDLLAGDLKSIARNVTHDRRRARNGHNTQRLAEIARLLATAASGDDSAWISFAGEAWRFLGMKGSDWARLLSTLRKSIQKSLVPGFFKRTLNTHFERQKI
jgi:hypothetical protein